MITIDSPDYRYNWIPASTYELLANPTSISAIVVQYKDVDKIKQTRSQIQKLIALNHKAAPDDYNIDPAKALMCE
jgi:hypothetical protein